MGLAHIVVASLLALSVIASPAPQSSTCVTVKTGILTSEKTTSGKYKPFAFNHLGQLAFYRTGSHPTIAASFQVCTPNYGENPNTDAAKSGRIYLPKLKKCLGISNQNDATGPYYVTALTCPNSAAGEMTTSKSWPFNFIRYLGGISWVGDGSSDGVIVQGECEDGNWGYLSDAAHTPISTISDSYRIQLTCRSSSGSSYSTLWVH